MIITNMYIFYDYLYNEFLIFLFLFFLSNLCISYYCSRNHGNTTYTTYTIRILPVYMSHASSATEFVLFCRGILFAFVSDFVFFTVEPFKNSSEGCIKFLF